MAETGVQSYGVNSNCGVKTHIFRMCSVLEREGMEWNGSVPRSWNGSDPVFGSKNSRNGMVPFGSVFCSVERDGTIPFLKLSITKLD